MRLPLALLAAFVVLAAGVAALAWAKPTPVESRITIHETDPGVAYKGRVFASKTACVNGRRVQFWRRHPGPDQLLNTISADADGRWSYGFVGDHYYVVARRAIVGSGSHAFVCKRARSATT